MKSTLGRGEIVSSLSIIFSHPNLHPSFSLSTSSFSSQSHGRDGLSSISTLPNNPYPTSDPSIPTSHPLTSTDLTSCDLILKLLKENPIHTVRIAAIGPLTNIALAFQKDPETFSRLGSLSIMGCSLDGPGNTTPVAGGFKNPVRSRRIIESSLFIRVSSVHRD